MSRADRLALAGMIAAGEGATATAHLRGEHGIFGPDCQLCLTWLLTVAAANH